MIIDFPNYSHVNPWQIKTIQTSAPMEVKVTNNLEITNCYALHISWEDRLLKKFTRLKKADKAITRFEDYLKKQSKRSKIIWTLHNLTSHYYELKEAEKKLRDVIMEYASTINLMSKKHAFLIPKKYQSKINIVPHYIDPCRFPEISKNSKLTYFKYGEDRGRLDNNFFLALLHDPKINKFVSDSRLDVELDTADTVITKRRFTCLEADLYAQLSNFSSFYQEAKFNSGVMNFLIGNKVAVLHDKNTVQYMELPESFSEYCLDLNILNQLSVEDIQSMIKIDNDNVNDYISKRSPKKVSDAFWKSVYA